MRRSALTLIEVVAALALMATTVTLLITAQGRSLEQLRATKDQVQAATLAGELIARWRLEATDTSLGSEGTFDGLTDWHWVRRISAWREPGFNEVTLTVHRRNEDGTESKLASYTWLERLPRSRQE